MEANNIRMMAGITANAGPAKNANAGRRIHWHTSCPKAKHVTNSMIQNNPYPPDYAIFAKGASAEKMIIVGLSDVRYNTLYRMRGLLANLTAVARVSPMFKDAHMEDFYTFLDLLKMLGSRRSPSPTAKVFRIGSTSNKRLLGQRPE